MTTDVTFYEDPINIDYLLPDVRLQFGDLTGSIFSDTILRTSLVSAVRYLQRYWRGKYQVFSTANMIVPQPSDVPSGYIRVNSQYGVADIPDTYIDGDVFRDPYRVFSIESPPLIEASDEQGIILAAKFILRTAQISSSALDFVAWGTEDIRYNNLGSERGLNKLLQNDLDQLNTFLRNIARARIVNFVPVPTEY